MSEKHIIAIGGGGFLTDSETGLDEYVLQQSKTTNPRIGFIGTATGDSEKPLSKFYLRFSSLNCRPSHLPLFSRTPNISNWIGEQDVIYVGGGNTKSMLAVWKEWGIPSLLKQAMENGTILAGVSAGAICWFDSGVTDSKDGTLGPMECLGFLSGSCCPHYSDDPERKPTYEHLVNSGGVSEGVAIDDGVAVHFIDGEIKRVVSGIAGASAYAVSLSVGSVITVPIESTKVAAV